ncbi:unnamed protein product [Rotaria sp. Silwood1]|nr:unnamed protein product [Rotaria sp. Silwood1]
MVSLNISMRFVFSSFCLLIISKSVNGLCKWYGTAPFCFINNSCPRGCAATLQSTTGDGHTCWFSYKNFCCCLPQIV